MLVLRLGGAILMRYRWSRDIPITIHSGSDSIIGFIVFMTPTTGSTW